MENILNLRKQKHLFYVISSDCQQKTYANKKIAVFINLYYEESAFYYDKYLSHLPKDIDVYIISSKYFFEDYAKKRNFIFLKKENRGRDVSALLVASRNYLSKYEYICFIHDKKSPHYNNNKLVDDWIKNMWENVLPFTSFVSNLISTFENNENLGLLVPPEPMFNEWSAYGKGLWGEDFANTVVLAKKLNVHANIDPDYEPITIGTVFWCRPKALKKLFDYNWKYEDFPDEPMPVDGTISHALERIIGYVAQDAGYDVGTVVSASYALEDYINLRYNYRDIMYSFSQKGVSSSFTGWENAIERENRISNLFKEHKSVYIYGAGKVARKFLLSVLSLNLIPTGILVTNKEADKDKLLDIDISDFDVADLDVENDFVIIAVGKQTQNEIIENLKKRNIKNYVIYNEL